MFQVLPQIEIVEAASARTHSQWFFMVCVVLYIGLYRNCHFEPTEPQGSPQQALLLRQKLCFHPFSPTPYALATLIRFTLGPFPTVSSLQGSNDYAVGLWEMW